MKSRWQTEILWQIAELDDKKIDIEEMEKYSYIAYIDYYFRASGSPIDDHWSLSNSVLYF
jgi:hypothetical protein